MATVLVKGQNTALPTNDVRVVVESVEVEADDAALRVTVAYVIRRTEARQLQRFELGGAS